MKKFILASALTLAATAASAWDLTVTGNRDLTADRNGAGLSISKNVEAGLSVGLGFDRFDYKKGNVDLFSAVASYEFIKVMGVGIAAQSAIAYNRSEFGADGFAFQPGIALNMPITKRTALVADVRKQYGENKIKYLDGTAVSIGLKTSF